MGEAGLNPEPVAHGHERAHGQSGGGGERPGRGEEEKIQGEEEGGGEVEGYVGQQVEDRKIRVQEKARVDSFDDPVEDRDAALKRGGCQSEQVLGAVERAGEGQVSEKGEDVGQEPEGQAAAGQKLQVPAPGFADGVGFVD